jgi:hypothetical protein
MRSACTGPGWRRDLIIQGPEGLIATQATAMVRPVNGEAH